MSLLKLNNLNESLERKYLTESEELTETMADMPDWLKKRILTTKYTRNDGQYGRNMGVKDTSYRNGRDVIDAKNPEAGPRPTYTKARGAKREDSSLFGQLLAHGINMDTVNIIEGPLPEKRTDPRLKEPNIPIFLFPNGQVYAKGINDNEEYAAAEYKAFKYVPMKTLLSEVSAFAYIDGTDDNNFKVKDKRAAREKTKNELRNIPNYNRDKSMAGHTDWRGTPLFDKSGYKIIKTVDRYKDKLAEMKCSKIYDVLQEKEDYLKEVKEELANIFMNTDIKDMHNDDPDFKAAFKGSDNIFDTFARAVDNYNACISHLDNIMKSDWDDERKKQEIIYFINYDSNFDRLNERIKEIQKMAPKVFNSIIDWI